MFEFKDDLDVILKSLDISQSELAEELSFDLPTVCNWLNGKFDPDNRSKEDIYDYVYSKGLRINEAYFESFSTLEKREKCKILYHGSRSGIVQDINLEFSRNNNDFSKGFYLGESLQQSCIFVCEENKPHVYAYGLFLDGLKIHEFDIDTNWAITIAYNRGKLDKYSKSKKLKEILNISQNKDLIIAPIADNRMFDIIDEFTLGMITDKACAYALNALNLGKQYVLKTNKALEKIGFIKEFYVCKKEKNDYIKEKNLLQQNRMKEISNFRSLNRKGKYIEEIL